MDKTLFFIKMVEKVGYRRLLYFLHGMTTMGVMHSGKQCEIEDPTFKITHGDVVHPCVRYFDEPFEGHHWWMVYTPLYNGNDALENPRLCFADAKQGEAPLKWNFYCTIKERPEFGYNSDPTMLLYEDKLYVFWREFETPNTARIHCKHATFGCIVMNKTVKYLPKATLIEERTDYKKHGDSDREISPTIISVNNAFRAYAMDVTFTPKCMYHLPHFVTDLLYRHNLMAITTALGFFNPRKSYGVAIWKGDRLENNFAYIKTTRFKGVSGIYQPWHMDIFIAKEDGKEKTYAIVQTSVEFADICLAYSNDGEEFTFFPKPLITSKKIGKSGIYKPTALVVDGYFYLYYTARDDEFNNINRLYMTSAKWPDILQILR